MTLKARVATHVIIRTFGADRFFDCHTFTSQFQNSFPQLLLHLMKTLNFTTDCLLGGKPQSPFRLCSVQPSGAGNHHLTVPELGGLIWVDNIDYVEEWLPRRGVAIEAISLACPWCLNPRVRHRDQAP